MPDPRRILIVRLSHLGDIVHALPVYHALRDEYPGARLAWAVQPEFAELVEGLPGIERVFRFGRRDGISAWPRLARELRDWKPDWTIDAQGNVKSGAVTWLSRAARRSGPNRHDWRERFGALAINDPAPRSSGTHAMDRALTLARHVAPQAFGNEEAARDPSLSNAELRRGEQLYRKRVGDVDSVTILHLAARDDVRSWPTESFVETARAGNRDGTVLVLSGPAEADEGHRVERELEEHSNVRHWVGQTGLRDLAAFFHVAARRGATLVACDSGPMHLAASVGLPVVLLAGPQAAERTGPWPINGPHDVVRADPAPECAPCLKRKCEHSSGNVCMTLISVPGVLRALAERDTTPSLDVRTAP